MSTEAALPGWSRALRQPSRYKGIHGGRGSGKSHSIAASLLLQGTEKPLRILCAREVQKSIRDSVKRLLDDWIGKLGLGSFYQSLDTEIRGRNGTLLLFAGLRSNTDSLKSMEGLDRVWIEEAQSVSQGSIDKLIPTVRKEGSEIWFSWNPDQAADPVDVLLRKDTPPDAIVLEVNFDRNPFFPDVLRREMEWDRSRDPEKYAHVWRGAYRQNSQARVFHNWRVADEDDAFWTAPEGTIWRFGADWGYAVDPSVLVRARLDGRTLYIDHEAYAVGCPIDETPALFAGTDARERWTNPAAYAGIPEALRWSIVADSARPETIAYMQARGFNVTPAVKGAGSVEDGVEFLKSVDIVVHPRCRHTIDELTFYSYKVDPHTAKVLPILADKNNHVIDALRYALEAVRRGGGAIEHVSAAPRAAVSMWDQGAAEPMPAMAGGMMWDF